MTENDGSRLATQVVAPRRIERRRAPVIGAVLLADVSESMDNLDGGDLAPRRIDRLAKVLDYLLTRVRVQGLICFSDLPVEIELVGRIALPEPSGSTALELALEHVFGLSPRPERVCVLSDGFPNDDKAALMWARRLRPMVLDAYYVGPDAWEAGLRFMRDLAAAGGPGGRSGHFDLVDPLLLGSELERRLLERPQP